MKLKLDSRSLHSKVALRRWLLDKMGLTTVRVLDLFAGTGRVWSEMENYVDITRWVKVDIKPRTPGTLKMTAITALHSLSLDDFDVIDIDSFGDPWDAYREVLARLPSRPIGVFLTHGHTMSLSVSYDTVRSEGIPHSWVTQRANSPHQTFLPQTPEAAIYFSQRVLRSTWHYADIEHSANIQLRRVAYYALTLRAVDRPAR